MKITSVLDGSPAARAGIRAGDLLAEIDGYPVCDHIDVLFHGAEEEVVLTIERDGESRTLTIESMGDWGIEFEDMRFRACGNRCLFCFVDQNPTGMRREVYFKDEDYRLSFLHGSYVTLTALSEADMRRIEAQRLSPLYVSVHATDPDVRRRLLGLRRDDRLMDKIDRLTAAGITLHTQAVICPGINDGDILDRTIRDLGARFPGVTSLAVVPVGLTKYRANLPALQPVDAVNARDVIGRVDRFREEFIARHGNGFAYCADEWYICAGREVPEDSYYGEYVQLENGVGMVRQFIDSLDRLERDGTPAVPPGRYALVTGRSMAPWIERFARLLSSAEGVHAETVAVPNEFYGELVTVSGLLTGGDIMRALGVLPPGTTVVLPPNCLNGDGRFLDDMTPDDLAGTLDARIVQGEYDPAETIELMQTLPER